MWAHQLVIVTSILPIILITELFSGVWSITSGEIFHCDAFFYRRWFSHPLFVCFPLSLSVLGNHLESMPLPHLILLHHMSGWLLGAPCVNSDTEIQNMYSTVASLL